jgi:hypothetical protein
LTVVPHASDRIVSAVLAFAAAIASGINGALTPEKRSQNAYGEVTDWRRWYDDLGALKRRSSFLSLEEAEHQYGQLLDRRDSILKVSSGVKAKEA